MFEIETRNALNAQRRQLRERQASVRRLVRQRRLERELQHPFAPPPEAA